MSEPDCLSVEQLRAALLNIAADVQQCGLIVAPQSIRRIADLLRHLESPWQPIETAPKDQQVLLCDREWIVVAEWSNSFGRFAISHDSDNPPVIGWTRWMPLPEPPRP